MTTDKSPCKITQILKKQKTVSLGTAISNYCGEMTHCCDLRMYLVELALYRCSTLSNVCGLSPVLHLILFGSPKALNPPEWWRWSGPNDSFMKSFLVAVCDEKQGNSLVLSPKNCLDM